MSYLIAGVDEVGVGPLAGPVVAAAVILNPAQKIYNLKDSKLITSAHRDILFDRIMNKALAVSLGMASVEEIDSLNIYHATALAIERAIRGLLLRPSMILVDGINRPKINDLPIKMIVQGDVTEKSISAASIIAKVTRDRIMLNYHQEFPHYRFDKHKGYSTKEHQKLIGKYGICIHHRRSFNFVKKHLILGQKDSDL